MPVREKAAGMKAARIVRRKPASARSIWISISTFASGGNPPPITLVLLRLPPCEREVICPSGSPVKRLSSPHSKNFFLYRLVETSLEPAPSHPETGAYRNRHGRGVGCDGRGSVLRATWLQGGFRPVSDQQHADERCLSRTAKSCGPDAPTLASSSRRHVGPTGRRQNLNPRTTVAREPGHRGEHEISR